MADRKLVLLFGGESMLGRDIFSTIETAFPSLGLKRVILGEPGAVAILPSFSPDDDEADLAPTVTEEDLSQAVAVIFAGDPEAMRAAYARVSAAGDSALLIDATGQLEGVAPTRMRAPDMEPRRGAIDLVQSVPSPPAFLLMRLLGLLHEKQPVQKTVAQIFQPASEWGRLAVEELHQQTIALLNFKPLPKKMFDTEATFQMLPRFGEDAKVSLQLAEQRVEKDLVSLAAILAATGDSMIPLPSFSILHAPLLHGTTLSVWVQFAKSPNLDELERHLKDEGADIRNADMEPASNRGVAGMEGFTLEALRKDRNDSRAVWFYLAADNHRTSSTIVTDILREVV